MEPITAREIYEFYQRHKGNDTQYNLICKFLAEKFNINPDKKSIEIKTIFRNEVDRLVSSFRKILIKAKSSKNSITLDQTIFVTEDKCTFLVELMEQYTSENSSSSEEEICDEIEEVEAENEKEEKKFYKTFGQLGSQRQRLRRIQDLMKTINNWVEKENFPLHRLLGFIGHSQYYLENKKLANVFERIWNDQDVELKNEIPIDTAIYLKEKSLMGKRNYTEMRLTLKPYVILPTYNAISSHMQQILPELRTMNEGIMARVIDVARCTIVRLPNEVIEAISKKVEKDSSIVFQANFSAGLDGSGGFRVHNSRSFLTSSTNTSHLIAAGMALSSIEMKDFPNTVVYNANKICSIQNQRPIGLVPGKESRSNIKDIINALDIGIFQGRENENLFDFGSFKARFRINIQLCQMDTKMIKMVTGLTGAYCTACLVTEEKAHNREKIINGFEMSRTPENMEKLFEELKVLDANGEEFIPKSTKDYEKRYGLCMPPLTKADVCSNITVLHSYLNALTFFERILYNLNANVFRMNSQFSKVTLTPNEKNDITRAKERLIARGRESPLFMKIDTHDASSSSGTSDTGNMARKFFSASSRNDVLDLIEGTGEELQRNKAKVNDLLQRFSIVLRILSSKSIKIDYTKFQQFCTDTYLATLEYFDWLHIPGSIHRLLGHCAERIHANGDYGLGTLSEEGLESSNKMIRRFRDLGARKIGLRENLIDVFSHLWAQSDGKIQAASRNYQCQNCLHTKPSKRGSNLPALSTTIIFTENDDDALLETLILF